MLSLFLCTGFRRNHPETVTIYVILPFLFHFLYNNLVGHRPPLVRHSADPEKRGTIFYFVSNLTNNISSYYIFSVSDTFTTPQYCVI